MYILIVILNKGKYQVSSFKGKGVMEIFLDMICYVLFLVKLFIAFFTDKNHVPENISLYLVIRIT